MQNMNKELGLYIHIPFCKSKCHYCDFNSFSCRDDFIPAYFNALKKEVNLYNNALENYEIKTVFIGGGTPSYVNANDINESMILLNEVFKISKNAEITIESNPGTLSKEKLKAYKDMGINRLSIGLQASQNHLLKQMGRIHRLEEFYHNYDLAKRVGFKDINVDLIFGIPGQTIDEWLECIKYINGLEITHVSCYSLKIEEGTVFGDKLKNGELIEMEDSDDRLMYWCAIKNLKEYGYKHYELSNFAKEGFECKHNLVYWKDDEYIGIGAGAHSFLNGERFNNKCGLKEYIEGLNEGNFPRENIQTITQKERMGEFMMLGLRLINGINVNEFEERFGTSIFNIFDKEMASVIKRGLAQIDRDYFKLTNLGLDLANQVFMEFV